MGGPYEKGGSKHHSYSSVIRNQGYLIMGGQDYNTPFALKIGPQDRKLCP
jgi:hypothetical protein